MHCSALCSVLTALQFHADVENTSENISPAPAFQTQAVSVSAHVAAAAQVYSPVSH